MMNQDGLSLVQTLRKFFASWWKRNSKLQRDMAALNSTNDASSSTPDQLASQRQFHELFHEDIFDQIEREDAPVFLHTDEYETAEDIHG